jgi:ectoine hydroxylase-related dioxygenase (phytanoyl-CoA dioxygenase family)
VIDSADQMVTDFVIVRSAVAPDTCAAWLAWVDDGYNCVDFAVDSGFVPESSSFPLRAAGLSILKAWSALCRPVHRHCARALGPTIAIDADQSWVRRQYAPGSAPPRHHPHSWHQDGALGFEFSPGGAIPDDALLPMVTCWIALTPCGVDAPGLEVVTDRVGRLLAPAELADGAIDQRWPMSRRRRPVLEAGDVLAFSGDTLHRTHVSESMTAPRTSIELRCFRAGSIPDRLTADEFLPAPTIT